MGKGVYFTDATVTNNSTITVDGSSINIGRVRGYEETGEPVTSSGNLGVLTNEENGDISLDEGILLLYYGAFLTNNGDIVSGNNSRIEVTNTVPFDIPIEGEKEDARLVNNGTITFVGDEPWGADRSYFYGTEGGLVNNGTLNVSGFLAASQSGLENNGTINIKDGVLVAGLSEVVNNSEINVANGDSEGILCADEGSEIINKGSITCSGGHIQAVYGGSITNSGTVTVTEGWLNVIGGTSDGASTLTNSGTITANDSWLNLNYEGTELKNTASGKISVSSSDDKDAGLDVSSALLTNNGEITVTGSNTFFGVGYNYVEEDFRHTGFGTLINAGAIILDGVDLHIVGGSSVTNSGTITMNGENHINVGRVHEENEVQYTSDGTLTMTDGGTIAAGESFTGAVCVWTDTSVVTGIPEEIPVVLQYEENNSDGGETENNAA